MKYIALILLSLVILQGETRSQDRPIVNLQVKDDPRPTDFVRKIFASGEKIKRGRVPYLIILRPERDAPDAINRYQIWGSEKILKRDTFEKIIEAIMAAEAADIYIVGSRWDERLDAVIEKVTKQHNTSAFLFQVMPKIGGVSFSPDSALRRKSIETAIEHAAK